VPLTSASAPGWAVVTGASIGIGAALATALAAQGRPIVVVARRGELLDALAAQLRSTYGVEVDVRVVDLADRAARAKLADELAARPIEILVNNAGVATFGPVAGLDPAYEKAQLEVNATAVHDLTLAVLPGMVERRAGGIIVTGSAAGNMPIPNNATYSATKAFANSFCEALHFELKPVGVHVTLLAPGPVRTDLPRGDDASFVERLVPRFMWVTYEEAAEKTLKALEQNRFRVVPGIVGKTMSGAGRFLPRRIMSPLAGSFYRKLGEGQQNAPRTGRAELE
jgi:uncharacterized protein